LRTPKTGSWSAVAYYRLDLAKLASPVATSRQWLLGGPMKGVVKDKTTPNQGGKVFFWF
jgi:hypothetical protein